MHPGLGLSKPVFLDSIEQHLINIAQSNWYLFGDAGD